MSENKSGKRLQEDGSSGGGKLALIIVGAVLAALVLVYFGLSAYVALSGKILPGTTAAGVALGGMTQAQAVSALEKSAAARYTSASLSFEVSSTDGLGGTVTGTDVTVDAAAAAQAALGSSTGNFFTGGWRFLSALFGGADLDAPLQFTPEGEKRLEDTLTQLSSTLNDTVQETDWALQSDKLLFHMGHPGQSIDAAALKAAVLDRFSTEDYSALTVDPVTTNPVEPNLEAIHQEIYAEVKDASLNPTTFEITPSVTGTSFDIASARQQLQSAAWDSDCAVPLVLVQPKVSTEQLQASLFKDVLGEATSRVSGSGNRKFNVKLSASVCNDKILLPGGVFAYNETTGSRSASKGYLPAPAYVNGLSVNELGGGICQTSSTIYYAALNANLKIVERKNHRYAVGYVPDGMDATVYYGSLDFRFENSTDYPIKILTESYDKGGSRYLTVTIMGTKVDDTYVKMTNRETGSEAPTTVYKLDASVPVGASKADSTSTAYRGRTVEAYRNVYSGDGKLISSTLESVNKYFKRDAIILVNPADAGLYGLDPATGKFTGVYTTPTPTTTPAPAVTPTPAPETPTVTPPPVTPSATPEIPVVTPTPPVETVPPVPQTTPSPPPDQTLPPDVAGTPPITTAPVDNTDSTLPALPTPVNEGGTE